MIGAGHNGLVAANLLADAGWDVTVLEREDEPGGAIRTAGLTLPGFHDDVFSAFFPLAVGSPVFRGLEQERYGLEWCRAPLVVAHPTRDGLCPLLSTDLDETAEALADEEPLDARRGGTCTSAGCASREPLLGALATPFKPVTDGPRMAARIGVRDLAPMARFLLLPVRRMGEEEFRGRSGALLLAGKALHSDLSAESLGSGLFGWLLASLGQHYGDPVPQGGAQRLIDALVRRLECRGGRLHCGVTVEGIVVRSGRAVAVRTGDCRELAARRAVLASVEAPQLLPDLVGEAHLPPASRGGLRRFQCDSATFKVDWALDGPIPWNAEAARRAGTLNLGDSLDEPTVHTNQVTRRLLPDNPYAVVGQMNVAEASCSSAGTQTAWAYTTLSQRIVGDASGQLSGQWRTREDEAFAERIKARIEALAPRLPGSHHQAAHPQAPGHARAQPQPGRWTAQRWDLPAVPAADLPAHARIRSARNAGAPPLPGLRLGPSGWRCARRAGRERGPRRTPCPPCPSGVAGAGAVAAGLAALARH